MKGFGLRTLPAYKSGMYPLLEIKLHTSIRHCSLYAIFCLFSFSAPVFGQSFGETLRAFSPIDGSRYTSMADLSVIDNPCIKKIWDRIPHRYGHNDARVADVVKEHLLFYRNSTVLMDSGHAHSIAAAVELVENGHQPIFKMHDYQKMFAIQPAGTMKHLTERMIKAKNKLSKDAPPVFILDAHRKRDFEAGGFPNGDELLENVGHKIIWVTENGSVYSAVAGRVDHAGAGHQVTLLKRNEVEAHLDEPQNIRYGYDFKALRGYIQDNRISLYEHGIFPYYLNGNPFFIKINTDNMPIECSNLKIPSH